MTFDPELGQLLTGATFTQTPTPHYVTAGFSILDALYADLFEGGKDHHARVANHGGSPIITDTFEMRPYCWCDGETEGHEEGCPPNFVHHPSGFQAHWYKHAERGETCNQAPTPLQWAAVLRQCIDAVLELPSAYRVLITGSRDYGSDLRVPGSKSRLREDWASAPSPQRDAMVAALRAARERAGDRPLLIIHGAANGADRLSGMLAMRTGVPTEEWPALWRREDGSTRGGYDREEALRVRAVYAPPGQPYNRQAGPERNRAMVAAGADECLAFKAIGAGNRGTQDCINVATAAGIPVTVTEA